MTLDQIVNEVHSYLEPIRAQCALFCLKTEEYAAVLEEYTREAIDRHMAEFDRRQKERERLGVELLPGESVFHCSDGKRFIQPSPQEEEFQKGPPQEEWIWTQFCDYNYVDPPDMDVFWRPPEPSHPLEWLWQSLPSWGHTSPTLARTKREWTDEEHLMCECLLLASIHDMRFFTALSRHKRVFLGRPYSGRFRRDEVAKDMWDAMHKSPRGLEDLQISWAWVKAEWDGRRSEQPSRKPRKKATPRGEGQGLASVIPELPPLVKIAGGAWFGLLAVRARIAAKYAAEKRLSPEQKDAVEEQFPVERFRAMRALELFLMGLPTLDQAARVRWHADYHSLSQRIQSLLENSLDKNTANQVGFQRLEVELANILMGMGFESTGEIWAIGWGDSPDSSPTDARVPEEGSSKTAGAPQGRNGPGQAGETPSLGTSPKRFAIALSFPGERRPFIESIASRLAEQVGQERVLYDNYHEAEFACPDLDVYLPNLYSTESELIVIFLCEDYAKKRWCKLEWRSIRQLISTSDSQRIMFISFDDIGPQPEIGIVSGDGYASVGSRSADEIAPLILQRLALNRQREDQT